MLSETLSKVTITKKLAINIYGNPSLINVDIAKIAAVIKALHHKGVKIEVISTLTRGVIFLAKEFNLKSV